jgi:hypothetical protein
MGQSFLARALRQLPIGCALLFSSASIAEKFEISTTGIDNSNAHDGLTPEQIKTLDKKTQDVINRFNKGRTDSSVGGAGRYSGTLEMHDADYDGITDHGNANNALEGGQEDAALGKGSRMPGGAKRNEALEKARRKAGKCTDKPGEYCGNISANLVDRGPAHGKDTPEKREPHRVYELTDEAKKNAEQAGKTYATQVIQDAGQYDASGAKGVRNVGADKNQVEVFDGRKWTRQNVAANPELLRSEAAWLEEQKARNVQNGWKMLRAKRLIGQIRAANENNIGWDDQLSSDEKKEYFKINPGAHPNLISDHDVDELVNSTYRSASQTGDTSREDQQLMAALSKKAAAELARRQQYLTMVLKRRGASTDPAVDKRAIEESQKQLQVNNDLLAKCMAQGAWCTNNSKLDPKLRGKLPNPPSTASPNAPRPTVDLVDIAKAGQDPGAAYQDTRELNYNLADQARRGPLANNVNNVRNSDFSENSDRATGAKIFNEYKQAADKALADAEAYKKDTQCMGDQACIARVVRATGRPYKPTPAAAGYDPRRQSATQLSKRGPNDGRTIARPGGSSPTNASFFGPNNLNQQQQPQPQPQRRNPAAATRIQ